MLQLNGLLPSATFTTALYCVPAVAFGTEVVGMEGSGTMNIVAFATCVGSLTEVAVTTAVVFTVVGAVYVALLLVRLLRLPGPLSTHVTP